MNFSFFRSRRKISSRRGQRFSKKMQILPSSSINSYYRNFSSVQNINTHAKKRRLSAIVTKNNVLNDQSKEIFSAASTLLLMKKKFKPVSFIATNPRLASLATNPRLASLTTNLRLASLATKPRQ